MEVLQIPESRLRYCCYCKCELDSNGRNTYRHGSAWFKNRVGKKQSIHGSTLTVFDNKYACQYCIKKMQDNVSLDQLTLFDAFFAEE